MEFAIALKELSGPSMRGDPVKAAIDRAAKAAGLHYWRAFDIWYGKARRIDAHEADAIRAALQSKREDEAVNEYQQLRTRMLQLESMLVRSQPHLDRATLAATGAGESGTRTGAGGVHRALARARP